ncbi:NMD3 family-domain-containing protein [Entophlyctis helioformis]|nr:NMD3 family-domain-containing protein [Entophlyctis helioformis]
MDSYGYIPQATEQRILCASCGTAVAPNAANMCVDCIRSQVDITEGIPKQATVHFCKGCDRYLQPPNVWVKAELESRELLSLCLRKLKGLNKVRLVDAGFIWTEPHSRRIKVKLSIQKEVFASAILQQVFVVEYIVANQYCEECTRVDAQLTWKAVVQVRQKVAHKRTFLWLEQLILKHNAHKDTTNIKEFRDGLDFYYVQRSHALKMVEFLQSVMPMRMKTSEQLISTDTHTGSSDYKFTFSVELVPICKDDLVVLSTKMARTLSNINPLALCIRVSNAITFIDPTTGRHSDLRAQNYWEAPFPALVENKDLIEFYIIDVQYEGQVGKYQLATCEVARSNDLSTTYFARTHLGFILNPGDHCKGYILANANFNNDNFDTLEMGTRRGTIPDVVLVRKSYPNARKRQRTRNWKLKNMVKEEDLDAHRTKADKARAEQDYEIFLRDVEEDPELRGMLNLYKGSGVVGGAAAAGANNGDDMDEDGDADMEDDDEDPEEDFPEIDIDDLLDDMEQMQLGDDEIAESYE